MSTSISSPLYSPLREPLRGAYCDLAELTGARFAAREVELRKLRRALSQMSGANRSAVRGRGLEFEEVRAYQAGDDVRSIDWRVTARSGRPFTKLFREERERPLLIVADQRQPMFFGSRYGFKSKLAAYLGALLAWAGLQDNDRVGGLVIGNERHHEIRPRRTRKAIMAWLSALHEFNHQLQRDTRLSRGADTSLIEALTDLRRIARPGSAIYLLSDFSGMENPRAHEQLYQLARHCEITALFVYDDLEQELPPPGQYTVTDGAQRLTLDTGDTKLRAFHRDYFEQHRQTVRQQLGGLSIPLLEVNTAQPPLAALARYLGAAR
jgi:uncharacterized protein (DUF58 family)